jgi:hypothetical protein
MNNLPDWTRSRLANVAEAGQDIVPDGPADRVQQIGLCNLADEHGLANSVTQSVEKRARLRSVERGRGSAGNEQDSENTGFHCKISLAEVSDRTTRPVAVQCHGVPAIAVPIGTGRSIAFSSSETRVAPASRLARRKMQDE